MRLVIRVNILMVISTLHSPTSRPSQGCFWTKLFLYGVNFSCLTAPQKRLWLAKFWKVITNVSLIEPPESYPDWYPPGIVRSDRRRSLRRVVQWWPQQPQSSTSNSSIGNELNFPAPAATLKTQLKFRTKTSTFHLGVCLYAFVTNDTTRARVQSKIENHKTNFTFSSQQLRMDMAWRWHKA